MEIFFKALSGIGSFTITCRYTSSNFFSFFFCLWEWLCHCFLMIFELTARTTYTFKNRQKVLRLNSYYYGFISYICLNVSTSFYTLTGITFFFLSDSPAELIRLNVHHFAQKFNSEMPDAPPPTEKDSLTSLWETVYDISAHSF